MAYICITQPTPHTKATLMVFTVTTVGTTGNLIVADFNVIGDVKHYVSLLGDDLRKTTTVLNNLNGATVTL